MLMVPHTTFKSKKKSRLGEKSRLAARVAPAFIRKKCTMLVDFSVFLARGEAIAGLQKCNTAFWEITNRERERWFEVFLCSMGVVFGGHERDERVRYVDQKETSADEKFPGIIPKWTCYFMIQFPTKAIALPSNLKPCLVIGAGMRVKKMRIK